MWTLVVGGAALLLHGAMAAGEESSPASGSTYPPFDFPEEDHCMYKGTRKEDSDSYVVKAAEYVDSSVQDYVNPIAAQCEVNGKTPAECTCKYLDKKRYSYGKNKYTQCNEDLIFMDGGELKSYKVYEKCPVMCNYFYKSKCYTTKYKEKYPYDDSCGYADEDISGMDGLNQLGGCSYYDPSLCTCKLLDEKYYKKGDVGYSKCMYDKDGNPEGYKDWAGKDKYLVSKYCPFTCQYIASSKCNKKYAKNYRTTNRDKVNAFEDKYVASVVIFIVLSILVLACYHFLGKMATGQANGDWTLQFSELHEMQNHAVGGVKSSDHGSGGEHKSHH